MTADLLGRLLPWAPAEIFPEGANSEASEGLKGIIICLVFTCGTQTPDVVFHSVGKSLVGSLRQTLSSSSSSSNFPLLE